MLCLVSLWRFSNGMDEGIFSLEALRLYDKKKAFMPFCVEPGGWSFESLGGRIHTRVPLPCHLRPCACPYAVGEKTRN